MDELGRDIRTGSSDDPGCASENSCPVPILDLSWLSGGWQTSELFRADRDPEDIPQAIKAISIFSDFAVITGAESCKAGTDKNDGGR